jgi:hypothetical protein
MLGMPVSGFTSLIIVEMLGMPVSGFTSFIIVKITIIRLGETL